MKIKTKLLGIFVLIIIIIAASIGVFAVFNILQQQIQSEKLIITELKDQLYKEASHISELCYTSVNTSLTSYREITQETIISFNNIAHIEYLKKNQNIAESLEQIRIMDAYMTSRRDRLFASGAAFLDTGTKLGLMSLTWLFVIFCQFSIILTVLCFYPTSKPQLPIQAALESWLNPAVPVLK